MKNIEHKDPNQGMILAEHLKSEISSRRVKVCVIGLGYVGLPLAIEKAKVGFNVLGLDQNKSRVDSINHGLNYIKDVDEGELRRFVTSGKLKATCDFSSVSEQDILIICVPTPLNKYREPDISFVENVIRELTKRLRPGQMIILESTTYPGTTKEVVLPLLESTGLKAGQDFFVIYSPERVDPGNQRYTTKNTSKVIGGITPLCQDIGCHFYAQTIINVVPVSSTTVAEMTKVFENTYRAVNIALVNELMMLCDKMKICVWEVIDAASTKPFGIQTFYPGPGVGGHCIPIDPFYLSWKARQYDFSTRFIELAGEINIRVSHYVVNKVIQALNHRSISLNRARVLVLGVAYKKDIDDCRESPAIRLIEQLTELGAHLVFYDPYIKSIVGHDGSILGIEWVDLTVAEIKKSDCVLIVTDHSLINYEELVAAASLIVDTRNATRNVRFGRDKIFLI